MKKKRRMDEYVVMNKFVGSAAWLWFWLIMCFPIGIVYFFMNREPTKMKVTR